MSGNSKVIGPSLPPGFGGVNQDKPEPCEVIGPALPPELNLGAGKKEVIGPELPPGLCIDESDIRTESDVPCIKRLKTETIGPVLPSTPDEDLSQDPKETAIGPVLPRSLLKSESKIEPVINDTVYIGPALPPGFKPTEAENLYGPPLPPNFKPKKSKGKKVIGPSLPPGFSLPVINTEDGESSEDEYIGPSLVDYHISDKNDDSVSKTVEARAKKMKDKLLGQEEDSAPKREDWMLQLPDVLCKKIGMGARTFSKKTGPSVSEVDRSGWTETPKEREKKEKELEETPEEAWKPTLEQVATHSRNTIIKSKIDEYNITKRKESLLDIHQKNLKKKLKKDKDKEKRREFDRDKDLNIQHVDKDGARNIIGGSKVFNSKFSHGSNHFL